MSEKKIIQFDAASQVNSDAYVPITQRVNGDQKTLKALIDQLGAYISRVQQYNDLVTTAKDLIGAINEAVQSGSIEMEQTVTTPVSIASFNDGGDNIPVKSLKVLVSAVQSGSGTPSPSNIRSISGWSGCNLGVSGINIWDEQYRIGAYNSSGEFVTGYNFVCNLNDVYVNGNTVYTTSRRIYRWEFDKDGNCIRTSADTGVGAFKTLENTRFIRFRDFVESSTYTNKFSINSSSTDTTYHAYKGTTHTIPFGQTVYGGLLDVTKGVLTITHGIVDLGTLSYIQTNHQTFGTYYYADVQSLGFKRQRDYSQAYNNICEEYAVVGRNANDFVDFTLAHDGNASAVTQIQVKNSNCADATAMKTALNGVQLVYELATPTVINLTPTQVKTLLTCNIFADTGDIDTLIYFNSNADETADVVEAYVGDVVNLYTTLATGNTSVSISSSAIHTNSTIDIYTDNDVDYISAVVTEGQIVITFDAQASDLGVKVRVS